MTITMALIPILGLLALFFVYMIFTSCRESRLVALRAEYDKLQQRTVQEDARLQETLLAELLEGKRPGEVLEEFQHQRAALLPGVRLGDPAAWDSEGLVEYCKQQLTSQAAEVSRKLATTAGIAALLIIAVCLSVVAVVYQFTPGVAPPGAIHNPLLDPFSSALPPAMDPLPSVPAQSPNPADVTPDPTPQPLPTGDQTAGVVRRSHST